MCVDPFTIATIASIGISTAGSLMQGQQAQASADMQARAYEQQAQAEQQASAFEAQRERRKQELLQANARAQIGASGVAFQGSPTEVLTANAREGQMDIAAIRYGSQLRQNALTTQADISRFSGKQAKSASYINAASGFVSGISSLYDPSRAVKMGGGGFSRQSLQNPFA